MYFYCCHSMYMYWSHICGHVYLSVDSLVILPTGNRFQEHWFWRKRNVNITLFRMFTLIQVIHWVDVHTVFLYHHNKLGFCGFWLLEMFWRCFQLLGKLKSRRPIFSTAQRVSIFFWKITFFIKCPYVWVLYF